MLDDKEDFADSIRSRRHEEFEARRRIREKEIADRKQRRRLERLIQLVDQFAKESKAELIETVKKEEEERLEVSALNSRHLNDHFCTA